MPPEGTICVECREPISIGQYWHKECISCRQPVHANGECSTPTFKCVGCEINDSCDTPVIPPELQPGTVEHGKHKNAVSKYLKEHLLHRDPAIHLSKWKRPRLYFELFRVPLHPDAQKQERKVPQKRKRRKSLKHRGAGTKQSRWHTWVRHHYDPLYRIVMVGSSVNPAGVSKPEWGPRAEQKDLTTLSKNLVSAGFPSAYAGHFFKEEEFPANYQQIKSKLSERSCYRCHCHVMSKWIDDSVSYPRTLKGILQKAVVPAEVSFDSIETPAYMDVAIPADRPREMSVDIPDGRRLTVSVPPDAVEFFHFKVPKRPNAYLDSQPTPPLIVKPGRRKKRRDPRRSVTTGIPTCKVCKSCRIMKRDHNDKKKSKKISDSVPLVSADSAALNKFRASVYQAGASSTGAHVRCSKGHGNHWCGETPSSAEHTTLGPYFIALFRERMTKRARRGRGHEAFVAISDALANLPILAKRVTSTRLQSVYENSFRHSRCARAIRQHRELCHKVEARRANKSRHEEMIRRLTCGAWRSSEAPAPATRHLHVDVVGRLLETESSTTPSENEFRRSEASLVYDGKHRQSITIFTWRLDIQTSNDDCLRWKTMLSGTYREKAIAKNSLWCDKITWSRVCIT